MDELAIYQPLKAGADNLPNQVARQIVALIRDHELEAGARLPPLSDLAEALNVSQNSLREAIKLLNAWGVVVTRHGVGTFVSKGIEGALSWNFERMNELNLYLPGDGPHTGDTRIYSSPDHPNHARFTPGAAMGLGYDDLKTIEAYRFLKSVADGKQGEPGLAEALAVAEVQAAIQRSWESERWEDVTPV